MSPKTEDRKPTTWTVDPRPGLQKRPTSISADIDHQHGRTTKPKVANGNVKKPGTRLRTIGDLPDVPRMLAHGARLAWAEGWEVRVGEPFNDTEARIVCKGDDAELALVWRHTLPDGVWAIFVRPWDSSVTHKIADVQTAVEIAAGREPLG